MSTSDGSKGSPVLHPPTTDTSVSTNITTGADSNSRWKRVLAKTLYTPPWLRYDPAKPMAYSQPLNFLFGLAAMITVANLYYVHPILNIIATDFGVSNEASSRIPTLAQAGYATGLLFVAPLGDLVPRRPFVLGLMTATATVWIGLCITQSFSVFQALTYITAIMTVTPQLMLPLVADLAPANRRATAVSIVTSGLLLGLLFARVMSGIVANFISWRYVYWIAAGLQYLVTIVLWFTLPDYPRTNKGLSYWRILWSIITITYSSPVLVQSCLIGFLLAAPFPAYWTTLTFLLSSPPYNYSPIIIGLFALIGIATMAAGPLVSRYVIDRYVPHLSVILGALAALVGLVIGTYTGTFTIAGPVIQAIFQDSGFQISQIANRSQIYAISTTARNRINTAYMVFVFGGQLTGTAVANRLYAQGGWILSGSVMVGFVGAAILVSLARGPWETGWVGWSGGWSFKRKALEEKNGAKDEETARPEAEGSDHGEQATFEKSSNGQVATSQMERSGSETTIRSPLAEGEARLQDVGNLKKGGAAGGTA